ncbi:MAG: transcription termination/antitermination protein NusA [Chloroflexi bacterium]|nr:transcription termination/antitermination protein NusA [Chloroflexota bacterium]MBL7061651.1 transcription termination/antitermination protein NusA [Dehalococcoidia bacterium]
MKTEFMIALTQLSAEKHLPKEVVLAAIESALVSAYRKDAFAAGQDVSAKINSNTGEVKVYVRKIVAEEFTDPIHEISLADAQKLDRNAQIGDTVSIESTPPNAGRIAAQTARQVILQRLHEAEHHAIFEEFTGKEDETVTGMVQRITPDQIHVDLGKAEAILPSSEQVHNERYRIGQRLKVYVLEVTKTSRGPQIIVSRSHRNLLRRLFELEIPEIYGGTIDIKSIAREAGHRSKVAVAARQEGIDPVGCCVGLRGIRIQNIVNELHGEKIDVIEWSDNPAVFIANALSPAQVSSVELNQTGNTAIVAAPDKQLSLAIGKEGQNARLAAKLTGWRIDIKSTSALEAEKASLDREAVAEEEEPVAEFAAAEELLGLVPVSEAAATGEPEPVGEEKIAEVAAASTDFELVLASEVSSPAKSAETRQIRFAEDILSPKTDKAKRRSSKKDTKKDAKKDTDLPKGKSRPKKTRSRPASYSEEDGLEE